MVLADRVPGLAPPVAVPAKVRLARRAQSGTTSPALPRLVRKRMRSSLRILSRFGVVVASADSATGCQYLRSTSPYGVPGPTWASSSSDAPAGRPYAVPVSMMLTSFR